LYHLLPDVYYQLEDSTQSQWLLVDEAKQQQRTISSNLRRMMACFLFVLTITAYCKSRRMKECEISKKDTISMQYQNIYSCWRPFASQAASSKCLVDDIYIVPALVP